MKKATCNLWGNVRIFFIERLVETIKIYIRVLLSWRSIATFALCTLGILLFYIIPWEPLQELLVKVLVCLFTWRGHVASHVNNYLVVDGFAVRIARACTYINFILVGFPFVLRGDSFIRDMLRVFLFVVIASGANILRLHLSIRWHAKGVSWEYAHGIINHLTYGPFSVLIAFLWLRAMKQRFIKSARVKFRTGTS